MKEETKIDGVYDDGSYSYFLQTVVMAENKEYSVNLLDYLWLLKYRVFRRDGCAQIRVSADFKSRYIFSEKFKLEVTVEAKDKKITEEFDLEKERGQCFTVDLLKNNFCGVRLEDIKVTVTVKVFKSADDIDEYPGQWSLYTSPSRPHDVVLVVGEKKFYLQKAQLATSSKYFNEILYVRNEKEVKIEDVDSDEFEKLMRIIHPVTGHSVDDSNVGYLLKLAGRFKMTGVQAMCGSHLLNFENAPSYTLMDRLLISDMHKLRHLQVACLKTFHRMPEREKNVFKRENSGKLRKLSHATLQNLSI